MDSIFSISSIKAIIGLGNPGGQYAKNRHNIGFQIVDELVKKHGNQWRTSGELATTEVQLVTNNNQQKIIIIKPQTYMNNSGRIVPFLQKKGIKPEEILVIHDELEKKLGTIQIRQGGSARGHNGLKSLINAMGENFWRMRFGIDRPSDRAEVPNYVLSNFEHNEDNQLPELVQKACILLTS